MKKILGLDIGTNSVGWAIINHDFQTKTGNILGIGSRIIPMSQDVISDFNQGKLQSAAAQRTMYRGVRRLRERSKNRRKRLIQVLKLIGYINNDFKVNHLHSFAYNKDEKKAVFKFESAYQEMKKDFIANSKKSNVIPHDWTIYFLRNKALTDRIEKEELAWIIMQFNTKRGYYQLRGDDELNTDNTKYFVKDIVDNIEEVDNVRNTKIFNIELRNGIIAQFRSTIEPDWIGREIEFIITEKKNKAGDLKVTLTQPDEEDWTLRKKRTESEISSTGKTPGTYIYQKLLKNPGIKIRGKEVHTIDRKFYKAELVKILDKQSEFHPELKDFSLLEKAAVLLYKNNHSHRRNLIKTSIKHLIIDDIIYYQRPLRSKKHLISDCKFEKYYFNLDGKVVSRPIKGIPKSHPLFQEFRIWSLIHNLKVFKKEFKDEKGIIRLNVDRTSEFLSYTNKAKLFDLFKTKKELSHNQILKGLGLKSSEFKLNYEEGKKLKGNETFASFYEVSNHSELSEELSEHLTDELKSELIWHSIYSLTNSEDELRSGLKNPKIGLSSELIEALVKVKPFKKDYGAFSKKALKKLLPLMRCGKYWELSKIDFQTRKRIDKIINAEYDEEISDRVRDKLKGISLIEELQALQDWLASYVVYGKHSEVTNITIYNHPDEIDTNKLIPHNSLRNPVVEKILRETMLVVRDIWKKYGKPEEIHVELARELKLPNEKRREYTNRRNQNELTNKRAKAMLLELSKEQNQINPFSIGQLELFKLYEEGALGLSSDISDDIKAIRKKGDPTTSELNRYKLWLDQKYISPYTGQPIPLSKLFTPEYEIEHIIPRSKYYDNSFFNKIICEREANELKGDKTAYAFICENGGSKLKNGFSILPKEDYEQLVADMFINNRGKFKNLLSYDVPQAFTNTQLTNTRYISSKLLDLLDPIIRDGKDTDVRSKNLIPLVGGITSKLKRDWGLNEVWKKILAPRFKRMNEITGTKEFYEEVNGKIHLYGNETDIKRLDHRHHALDALVIACTSRSHIQYINSYNNEKIRYDLQSKLFRKNENNYRDRIYQKPWTEFTQDTYYKLSNTITSFKSNHRVINRTKNYFQKYIEKNGISKKTFIPQQKTEGFWSIRKSLHKETVYGRRQIREYKSVSLKQGVKDPAIIASRDVKKEIIKRLKHFNNDSKVVLNDIKKNPIFLDGKKVERVQIIVDNDNYSSSRISIGPDLTRKKIIEKVLDKKIKYDLLEHLLKYDDDPKEAFGPNGLITFNKNGQIPVYKVTVIEDMGKKFSLADTGLNSKKYVEAAKGTNLFFVIYRNKETGELHVNKDSTIGFGDVVDLMKEGLPIIEEKYGYDHFVISPDDIVYVIDNEEERTNPIFSDNSKFYKCVSFTKAQAFFKPLNTTSPIVSKLEFGSLNKQEKSLDGLMIKTNCTKVSITRLGEILL